MTYGTRPTYYARLIIMMTTNTAIPKTQPLVRDLMRIGVATCPADTPVTEAARILLENGLEALVVLDENGHAAGLFGRREAVVAFGLSEIGREGIELQTVADALRPDIPEIPPDIPATAAAQLMLDQGVRELYLLHHDGGISWPAAVLRFEDILSYLAAKEEGDSPAVGARAVRKSPIELFKERYGLEKSRSS